MPTAHRRVVGSANRCSCPSPDRARQTTAGESGSDDLVPKHCARCVRGGLTRTERCLPPLVLALANQARSSPVGQQPRGRRQRTGRTDADRWRACTAVMEEVRETPRHPSAVAFRSGCTFPVTTLNDLRLAHREPQHQCSPWTLIRNGFDASAKCQRGESTIRSVSGTALLIDIVAYGVRCNER